MAMKLFTVLKGLLIKQEGTLNPTTIEISSSSLSGSSMTLDFQHVDDSRIVVPTSTGADAQMVITDVTQTLTNKTIDGNDNTMTNIPSSALGTGIDAAKIADGSVSNAEFQRLDGVTSSIQTQLNQKTTDLNAHINDATDAHDASAISNVASGPIASTNVQDAINELATLIADNNPTPEIRPAVSVNPGETIPNSADVVFVNMASGSGTITLPANPSEGQILKLIGQNADFGFSINVVANSGQLIEGITLPLIRYQQGFSIRYEGTAWILTAVYSQGRISGYTVGDIDTQTLTNKTIDTATNTINATGATTGYVLTANAGATIWAPSSGGSTAVDTSPVLDILTVTGGTYLPTYYFALVSANATAGATYTHNGNTYTVTTTISGGALLRTTGTGAPTASGTLTKTGGTGDNSISFLVSKAPKLMIVELIGGGGGGSAGNIGPAGSNGTQTTFGNYVADGGSGAGVVGTAVQGGQGGGGNLNGNPGIIGVGGNGAYGAFIGGALGVGGNGGVSHFGSGGAGRYGNNVGLSAQQGSGGGGGGGGGGTTSSIGGSGGGAGGYVIGYIYNPTSTYAYSPGPGGSGGGPASPGHGNGGNGGSGQIRVLQLF